jgi:hypothetical protein
MAWITPTQSGCLRLIDKLKRVINIAGSARLVLCNVVDDAVE